MKLKKFTAQTLKDATEAMRMELGESAIILHTKNILNENSGDTSFEITAAIDDEPLVRNAQTPVDNSPIPELTTLDNLKKIAEKFQNIREERSNEISSSEKNSEILNIKNDLNSVKGALGEIADRLKSDKLPELPKKLRDVYDLLVQNEVDEKNARDLVYEISEVLINSDTPDEVINSLIIKNISEKIVTAPPMKINHKNSKIIAFIGSTGVGKTTTICKIAAVCKYFNHYNVAIISVDTYRLAAIDQLKTFTDIANIPLEIAYSAQELVEMVNKHNDKELIFIDTVGRSPNNEDHLAELKSFIEATSADEVQLIISASTGLSVMKETVNKFGAIMPNRLVVSKLDEAVNFGNILNIISYSQLPLSYVTTGQVIPDDIEVADKNKLAALILKSKAADEWPA